MPKRIRLFHSTRRYRRQDDLNIALRTLIPTGHTVPYVVEKYRD